MLREDVVYKVSLATAVRCIKAPCDPSFTTDTYYSVSGIKLGWKVVTLGKEGKTTWFHADGTQAFPAFVVPKKGQVLTQSVESVREYLQSFLDYQTLGNSLETALGKAECSA